MNREQLVALMATEADITQKAADKALKAFIKAVSDTVAVGDKLSLIGFGTFGLKERKERTGVNPKTGETIKINAAKIPYFKPSDKLKQKANSE